MVSIKIQEILSRLEDAITPGVNASFCSKLHLNVMMQKPGNPKGKPGFLSAAITKHNRHRFAIIAIFVLKAASVLVIPTNCKVFIFELSAIQMRFTNHYIQCNHISYRTKKNRLIRPSMTSTNAATTSTSGRMYRM